MTDLALKWIPRFDFGSSTLTLTYPIMRWNPGARTEGRVLTSISGILGPYLRLQKYTLAFTLRFTEDEWPNIVTLLSFAQLGEPFTWHPNGQDPYVPDTVDVFLELPRVATAIKPTRMAEPLWLFTLPIVVSRLDAPWNFEYFRIPVGT